MLSDVNHSKTAPPEGVLSRRVFLGLLSALAVSPPLFADAPKPGIIPVTAINHIMIKVSDPARSLKWYQGLFGMPIVARQADTVILRIGDGPQFLAIAGDAGAKPGIARFGLSTDNFNADRVMRTLNAHGVISSQKPGPMKAHLRIRGRQLGGAPDGTPEVFFGDPGGILAQLHDSSYCGGTGLLGNKHLKTPEPAPTGGLLAIREYNHISAFVSDQKRSVAFYQRLFGMPIDTYQGSMPILRVGKGNHFLAFAGGARSRPFIHHACFSVDNFDLDRILGVLANYGLKHRGRKRGATGPLQSYVTMRMPDRGGAPGGTPELYFTDPDGIVLQIQDVRYCGGSGYLGDQRGTPRNAKERNPK